MFTLLFKLSSGCEISVIVICIQGVDTFEGRNVRKPNLYKFIDYFHEAVHLKSSAKRLLISTDTGRKRREKLAEIIQVNPRRKIRVLTTRCVAISVIPCLTLKLMTDYTRYVEIPPGVVTGFDIRNAARRVRLIGNSARLD